MNDHAHTQTTLPDSLQAEFSTNGNPPINQLEMPGNKYELRGMEKSVEELDAEISDKAKNFEAGCKLFVAMLDGAGVKFLNSRAQKYGYSEDECEAISEKARMDGDTAKSPMVKASSRLCARYLKSSEILDWAMLTGSLAQWGTALVIAAKELAKDRLERPTEVITGHD